MTGIRRICFFAGPGAGKSTLAAGVFFEMKKRGFDVEHIPEYIKTWAHEGRKPYSYDQLYVFSKQLKSEDVILRNVQHIVTDSPLMMNCAYSSSYNFPAVDYLVGLAKAFEEEFPSLNFYIDRTVDYIDKGRYQNYDEAVEFDNYLLSFLGEHLSGELHHVTTDNFDEIMSKIEEATRGSDS